MSGKGGRSGTTVRLVSEQLGSAPEHLRSRQRVGAPGSDRRLQRLIVDMGAVGDHRAIVGDERREIDAERKIDKNKAEKLARKVKKGKRFDLEDFRDQLQQIGNMGGITGMLDKLPGMGGMAQAAQQNLDIVDEEIGILEIAEDAKIDEYGRIESCFALRFAPLFHRQSGEIIDAG